MVPFYGQGMNCGFEDVRVLWEHIMEKPTISAALEAYTCERHEDCVTINDLAMKNYVEMRASVTSWKYLFKKNLEEFLYNWMPFLGIRTQYSMVSFSNIRYSEVMRRIRRQEKILGNVGTCLFLSLLGVSGYVTWRYNLLPLGLELGQELQKRVMRGDWDFRKVDFRSIGSRVTANFFTNACSNTCGNGGCTYSIGDQRSLGEDV